MYLLAERPYDLRASRSHLQHRPFTQLGMHWGDSGEVPPKGALFKPRVGMEPAIFWAAGPNPLVDKTPPVHKSHYTEIGRWNAHTIGFERTQYPAAHKCQSANESPATYVKKPSKKT